MQAEQRLNATPQKLKSPSVLLIDDEADTLTILKRTLEAAGMNTYGFTNPVMAVEHFKNSANDYDIVVTDIRMPHMNGFQVARAIKDIRPDIKIGIATSFEINQSEFGRILPSTRVNAFITKPIAPVRFLEIINGIMEQTGSED